MVYVFPVIFTPNRSGGYGIQFPDIPGMNSKADNMADAIYVARDILAFKLDYLMDNSMYIPEPTIPYTGHLEPGQIVTLIDADMVAYRRRKNAKTVNRTVALPAWLNEEAEDCKLNFSAVLQQALKQRLNIQDN